MDFNNLSDPKKYKTLNEDDILREWARQICDFTGFENKIEDSLVKQ